jgi:hypothetical protein
MDHITGWEAKQQNISPLGPKMGSFLVNKSNGIETAMLNAE